MGHEPPVGAISEPSARGLVAYSRIRLQPMNGQTNETPAARVEARLRKARIWEKLAGEVAGLGVWEWRDRTWRCSRECLRLLGLARSKAALSHDDWKTSIDPRDREKAQRDLDKALESGAEYESEYRIITPDGSSPRQRAEFRRQLPEFASVMGWIGRSASVYRLLVRQRNPQRIEDFCLAGVGNRQPCDAGLLIHSIFQ